MSTWLFWGFLILCVWIGARFAFYYKTADAVGTWPRIVEAAGDSATYFVAKATMFAAALMGLAANAGDFLSWSPEVKAAVQGVVASLTSNPTLIALAGIGITGLIWWARSRTKKA